MSRARDQLTERQLQVAAGLSRHLTLKQIAAELDVSTSAVNKHIAGLKAHFGANTRAEIVAAFLSGHSEQGVQKPSGSFCHLPGPAVDSARAASDDPGLLRFADGADYPLDTAPSVAIEWPGLNEPQVVPRWLDGRNATPARLGLVFGGIFAVLASFVLMVNLAQTTSQLVGGSAPDLALQKEAVR